MNNIDDHPLRRLNAAGQSPWYDNIHRSMLEGGALAGSAHDDELVAGLQALVGVRVHDGERAPQDGDDRGAGAPTHLHLLDGLQQLASAAAGQRS